MKGETVKLVVKTATGVDPFGVATYTTTEETVNDVLVGNAEASEAVNELTLTGKRIAFVLGIPKGDTHNWKDTEVKIRGERFRTFGAPLVQTEANVPGRWNMQVKVERYE